MKKIILLLLSPSEGRSRSVRGRQKLHPATKTFLALRICGESRDGRVSSSFFLGIALRLGSS
jgi:hypothetical protein